MYRPWTLSARLPRPLFGGDTAWDEPETTGSPTADDSAADPEPELGTPALLSRLDRLEATLARPDLDRTALQAAAGELRRIAGETRTEALRANLVFGVGLLLACSGLALLLCTP